MKKGIKKALILFNIVKLPFTIYLLVSLLIVPNINSIESIETKMIKGAHRGASLDYEENTIPAFEKALESPEYQFIEFDIEYTKDKQIAVIHQNTKYRIPKNFTKVENVTFEELNTKFEQEIPKYDEVMELVSGEKPLDIEIKTSGNTEQDFELVEFVMNDIEEREIANKIMVSSPSEEVIKYIEQNYPEIKTGKVYWITPYSLIPSDKTAKKFYENTTADYVLLHGYNIRNINTLIENKPEDKGLMIWYFTDEIYIIGNPEENQFWED